MPRAYKLSEEDRQRRRDNMRRVRASLSDEQIKAIASAGGKAKARLSRELAIEDEQWEAALARDPDKLKRMVEEALEDIKAGRSEPLDPDKL